MHHDALLIEAEEVDPRDMADHEMKEAIRELFARFDKYTAQIMIADEVRRYVGPRKVYVLEQL